jgi:hypothetical protein
MAYTERKEIKIPESEIPRQDEVVTEIPDEIEAKEGIQAVKTQITAKVEEAGKPLMESPVTRVTSIVIPENKETLEVYSKGSTEDAKTWWGKTLLRLIQKALHFGWQVVRSK